MVTRTQNVSANTTNVAITAATTGDLILVFAYNNASTTIPTLATNFTSLATQAPGASANASRVGYKISTGGETSSGTWTTATNVVCHVYRGTGIPLTLASTAGNSTTLSYGGGAITSGSWVAGFGGAKAATAGMNGSTTTLGNRTSQTTVNGLDSNAGLGAFSAETLTVTTTGQWVTETVQIPQAFQADDSAFGWTPPVVVASILALLLPFSGTAVPAGAAPTPIIEEYWQVPAPPLVPVRVWFASDDDPLPPQPVSDEGIWPPPVFLSETRVSLVPVGPGATGPSSAAAPAATEDYQWPTLDDRTVYESRILTWWSDGTLPTVPVEPDPWVAPLPVPQPRPVLWATDEDLPPAAQPTAVGDDAAWSLPVFLLETTARLLPVGPGATDATVTAPAVVIDEVYWWGGSALLISPVARAAVVVAPAGDDGRGGPQTYTYTATLVAMGGVARVLQTRLTRTRAAVGVVTHGALIVHLITRALVAIGIPHRILQTRLVTRALVGHGVAAATRQTRVVRALLEFAAAASIRQTRKTRAAVATGLAHLAQTRFTMVTRALIAHGIVAFQAVYLPFTAGLGNIYVNILRRRRRKKD